MNNSGNIKMSDSVLGFLRLTRDLFFLPFNYFYDFYRYLRYSSIAVVSQDDFKLRAKILKGFHAIEKGLSLPSPRPGFGQKVIKGLIKSIDLYVDKHGVDKVILSALNALTTYQEFNRGYDISFDYLDQYLVSSEVYCHQYKCQEGGVLKIKRDEVIENSAGSFENLAINRHSIRVFDSVPVPIEKIVKAAEIAKKTPSVCNRQTAQIFVFSDEEDKAKILDLQNGNRGFGHLASHIVAITSDLKCFDSIGERSQPYVDGGLMAMSFVYALQSQGIGSCFLNWSVRANLDVSLKKITNIPASHIVVTLIAIGNIPTELLVAESPRLDLEQILHIK